MRGLRFRYPCCCCSQSALQNVTLSGAEFVFNSFLSSFTEDLNHRGHNRVGRDVRWYSCEGHSGCFRHSTTPRQLYHISFTPPAVRDDTHSVQTTRLCTASPVTFETGYRSPERETAGSEQDPVCRRGVMRRSSYLLGRILMSHRRHAFLALCDLRVDRKRGKDDSSCFQWRASSTEYRAKS